MDMSEIENKSNITSVTLLTLFTSFLKLGLTSYGGPAIVRHIHRMVVDRKKWLEDETFRHGIAICQIIPGAISMNTAAYAGLKLRGIAGAAISYVAFGLPAFILILILSALYMKFSSLPTIISIFTGLKLVVIAIMADATLAYGRNTIVSWREIIITLFAAILFNIGINPIVVIISSAILGILLFIKSPVRLSAIESGSSTYSLKPLLYVLAAGLLGLLAMFTFNRDLLTLTLVMFRIDIFAFGGAYTSVPLMYHEIVEVHHWLSQSVFLDGMVLGQITPGPIGMTATFAGYSLYGFVGAITATISMLLPSFILLVIVVPYFDKMNKSTYFNKAMYGVLCSFAGLLLAVTIQFASGITWDTIPIIFTIAAFIALLFKLDILWVVLGGALISIFAFRQ
jgi:chromate transporter